MSGWASLWFLLPSLGSFMLLGEVSNVALSSTVLLRFSSSQLGAVYSITTPTPRHLEAGRVPFGYHNDQGVPLASSSWGRAWMLEFCSEASQNSSP